MDTATLSCRLIYLFPVFAPSHLQQNRTPVQFVSLDSGESCCDGGNTKQKSGHLKSVGGGEESCGPSRSFVPDTVRSARRARVRDLCQRGARARGQDIVRRSEYAVTSGRKMGCG